MIRTDVALREIGILQDQLRVAREQLDVVVIQRDQLEVVLMEIWVAGQWNIDRRVPHGCKGRSFTIPKDRAFDLFNRSQTAATKGEPPVEANEAVKARRGRPWPGSRRPQPGDRGRRQRGGQQGGAS